MRKMKAVVREFIDKALESANGSFDTDEGNAHEKD